MGGLATNPVPRSLSTVRLGTVLSAPAQSLIVILIRFDSEDAHDTQEHIHSVRADVRHHKKNEWFDYCSKKWMRGQRHLKVPILVCAEEFP